MPPSSIPMQFNYFSNPFFSRQGLLCISADWLLQQIHTFQELFWRSSPLDTQNAWNKSTTTSIFLVPNKLSIGKILINLGIYIRLSWKNQISGNLSMHISFSLHKFMAFTCFNIATFTYFSHVRYVFSSLFPVSNPFRIQITYYQYALIFFISVFQGKMMRRLQIKPRCFSMETKICGLLRGSSVVFLQNKWKINKYKRSTCLLW
jgi:hypothetical protein